MTAADPDVASVLAAFAEHRITLQRCDGCGRHRFPPMPSCPWCGDPGWSRADAAGTGTVYSWVGIRRALSPSSPPVPFTVAAVDLDEGCRMFGVLTGDEPVEPGERVRAVFIDHGDETEVQWERTPERSG